MKSEGPRRVSERDAPPPSFSRRVLLAAAGGAAASLAVRPAFAVPAAAPDLTRLTLKQSSEMLRKKTTSPVELTRACLGRIEAQKAALNAFIAVTSDDALKTAAAMEAEQRHGKWRGPLHGIPIALKDNIDVAGVPTTAGSALFKDNVPAEDADVVRRLKAAGAIILGKLNMHEFAYGGTSDVTAFGPVHNPWSPDHIAGGSSGGSAAAIAGDLCFGALGTDTGGSIRVPSSYCATVGLKPTYGRVSNRGVIPLSWSADHVGPIAKTVEDAALLLAAIAGYDALDPAAVDRPVPDYRAVALRTDVSRLRLGVLRPSFFEDLDPEVAKAMEAALAVLRKLTKSAVDTKLPTPAPLTPILGAEAYAYHAKWIAKSPEKYQAVTRGRIVDLGAVGKSPDYADALRQMAVQRRQIGAEFANVDLFISPTTRRPAATFTDGGKLELPSFQNTSPFNVFGLPSISLPCGFTQAGLPIGLQISGAPFAETTVLALGHAYERETEWHKRRPPSPTVTGG